MKRIWEESSLYPLPNIPDINDAWMRLEQRMEIEDSKENKVVVSQLSTIKNYINPIRILAFTIVLALGLATPSLYSHFTTTTILTERGQFKKVLLTDGSTVTLNADSKISYKKGFGKDHRHLILQGEAFFEVEKDQVPFVVDFGSTSVEVYGTKFNIKNRPEDVEVAVVEGKVKVSENRNQNHSGVFLTNGQLVKVIDHLKIGPLKNFVFDEYPGWINNRLVLQNSKLLTVCNEIERKFDVNIEFESASLGDLKITGIIEAKDLIFVLETLSVLAQRSYRFEKDTYIIY